MTRWRWPLYILSLAFVLAVSYYGKLYIMHLWAPGIAITPFIRRLLFFPPIAFLMASVVYSLVRDRIRLDRVQKERRAERLAAELKFLRQQISPHFLFNMMTNMVSLARQGSPLLEPSLIKLSELLRYSLYESGDSKILLSSEVSLVRNFVDLQQLRFGEDVEISMDMPYLTAGEVIEPMLLIPFVENAFKHGIGMVAHAFIHILLKLEGSTLYFMVSNNYNRDGFAKDKSPGIGLANTRSRLELLYPGQYRLNITDRDEIYTVELNLVLS